MEHQQPAYFIFDTQITDIERLQPYLSQVKETYEAFGGKMLVQGGALEVFEGQAPQGNIVILQFDSMQAAQGWYASDAYQAIVRYRHASSQANGWLVQGLTAISA